MILRVGLTGGIATGKSTVARLFADRGVITIDADKVVAELYRRGNAGYAAIIRTYGENVLREDGEIDRVALSRIAFSSETEAKKLNALIHPLVIAREAEMAAELAGSSEDAIVMIEATLLLESGGRQRYDRIVVVDVPPELQRQRGVGRGMAEEEVQRRMAHQMPREQRLAAADYAIVNTGDLADTARRVDTVHARLLTDLAAKKSPGLAPEA